MKPTVQNPDLYLVGNDYVQAPLSAFYKTGSAFSGIGPDGKAYVDDTYRDGIYRVLSDDLVNGAFSGDPWKDPKGFNKRTILVDPQSPIPTYVPEDEDNKYSVADVVYGVGPEDNKDIDPKTGSPVKD